MKLTENFIREGIINADDKEIIEFGLARIKDLIIGLCITLLSGYALYQGELNILDIQYAIENNAGDIMLIAELDAIDIINIYNYLLLFYIKCFWKEVPSFLCLLFWSIIYKMSQCKIKKRTGC